MPVFTKWDLHSHESDICPPCPWYCSRVFYYYDTRVNRNVTTHIKDGATNLQRLPQAPPAVPPNGAEANDINMQKC